MADFKTMTPKDMVALIGAAPCTDSRPSLQNAARAALKYYLARTMPAGHQLADATARNAAPVATLWDAYHMDHAPFAAYSANMWPAKPYTGPRKRSDGSSTPRPPATPTDLPNEATDTTDDATETPNTKAEPMPAKTQTTDADEAARKIAKILEGLAPKLDETRVREIAAEEAGKAARVEYRERLIIQKPDGTKAELPADEPRHSAFADCLDVLDAGLNLMLIGPAGCGKTHLAEQLAKARGKRFAFTGAVPAEYKLLGFIRPDGVQVRTTYLDMYENGGDFLFDEMDASSANALLAFNAGLANGHQDFPGGMVARHKDFAAVGSMNTFGRGADRQYVGRNQLDAAALDRWTVLAINYDEVMERALFGDNEWTGYIHKVRNAVSDLKVRHVVSMRAIAAGKKLIERGWSRDKAASAALWKGLDAETVRKIENHAGV